MIDTPDPIPQARESAVEVRHLPSRDELARMLDARAFSDAQHPHDESMIIQTDRVRAAYETADQLLAYFGLDKTALATPSGDDAAELRALVARLQERLDVREATGRALVDRATAAEAQRDALQADVVRLTPYVEGFRREERRADLSEEKIDALQKRVRVVEEALRSFSLGDDKTDDLLLGYLTPDTNRTITVRNGDLRRARAALTSHQQGNGGEGHGG